MRTTSALTAAAASCASALERLVGGGGDLSVTEPLDVATVVFNTWELRIDIDDVVYRLLTTPHLPALPGGFAARFTVKVHHLNCATMCPPLGRLLNSERKMVCHVLLIEGRNGLVLVDTGIGTTEIAHPKARLGATFVRLTRPTLDLSETALAQVEALGYGSEDVRDIVLTHLDVDHAGGLSDFPHAKVHTYRPEYHAATGARKRSLTSARYRPALWEHEPDWVIHDLDGERWFEFESVRAVGGSDDAVLLVPLLGHSAGHCGVAVSTPDGWLLHCGDAYFYNGEMDSDRRRCTPGLRFFQNVVQVDRHQRKHNQQRLRSLKQAHEREVQIFCAHDPTELERARGR